MTTSSQIIKRIFSPTALVGQVYARERGTTQIPMPLGNVLELELTHKENVIKQPDMTALGGGTHAEMRRVEEVEISMKLADLNVTNQARAMLGTVRGVEAGSASNEAHTVMRGGLLRTEHINPKDVVVTKGTAAGTATVTDEEHLNVTKGALVPLAHLTSAPATGVTVRMGTSVASATPLTAAGNYTVVAGGIQVAANATDVVDGTGFWVSYTYATVGTVVSATGTYEVRPAGVFILPEAAGLADGDQVKLAYTYGSYAVIEALTTKAKELELIFEGLNEADDGKAKIVEIWRASQGVASAIGLLADKGFASLPVTGAVLKDDTKTGDGISRYYRVRTV
ncbi:hypothetical protein QRO08_12550 [Paracidovorax citrulli]|uniref:Uncharacterized protein n=2 Tax=Paracidovorax citrulli TaxID=80869 RepID=A1TR71_PARC0|nr:hypothetical protein [Paracidovorax citrulli]ABM33459.1 hypothetical protein Aave_2891 [Paracidovorax citrulli AAC00-1]ATG94083.1 hypothetical protein CQB05_08620 [Paracidovorax citrulli]MVT28184.1 hypothetical protein [Paracidovorax citrulli]PVY67567.1 hypothetical protein C8E08_5015 [Paracidovorax citrulli]REG68274.1 hypothetical protein C8E07_1376 [Paracidovorax citrulli]